MGKVIHRDLCKKSKFDHTTKWHMHKQKPIHKNEMYKIFRGFTLRRREIALIKKRRKLAHERTLQCQQTTERKSKIAK